MASLKACQVVCCIHVRLHHVLDAAFQVSLLCTESTEGGMNPAVHQCLPTSCGWEGQLCFQALFFSIYNYLSCAAAVCKPVSPPCPCWSSEQPACEFSRVSLTGQGEFARVDPPARIVKHFNKMAAEIHC